MIILKKIIKKYYKKFYKSFLFFMFLQILITLNAYGGKFKSRYCNFTNVAEHSNKLTKISLWRRQNSSDSDTLFTSKPTQKNLSWLKKPILAYKKRTYLSTTKKDEYTQDLSLSELQNNKSLMENFLKTSINKNEIYVIKNIEKLVSKVSRIITVAETETGRKFLKLSDTERALREHKGGKTLAKYLPTVETDIIKLKNVGILIRPYIEVNENINFLGELIGKIQLYERERERLPFYFLQIFDPLFEQALTTNMLTIEHSRKPVLNDYLYYDKLKTWENDKIKGRIEEYYTEQPFCLGEKPINWEKLFLKKWQINGIRYKESLDTLLNSARFNLSPNNKRVLGISHGDWHEMNILTSICDKKYTYSYIDTELSGLNDLIGDAIVYLTYTSLFAGYLLPKYFPERLQNPSHILSAFNVASHRENNRLKFNITEDAVEVYNYRNFDIDGIRKKISLRFVEKYLTQLLRVSESLYGKEIGVFNEEHMRSCFLVRMLGTYNLRNFELNDQLMLMCLIYKVLGSPINKTDQRSFLLRFFDSI